VSDRTFALVIWLALAVVFAAVLLIDGGGNHWQPPGRP
jgi:hypothetical protein